ncbi:MAG: hypothetical protein DRG40_00235 [Deltaproteobacteria bacterium]|nr:MAG: hypothetical protein DRG40_00235 [Deltaproteobacteria bacterium]
MSKPKVSVLMSVYNGERYLREAIESILNQTFTDFEFIIIDDGSTDSTPKILTSYASKDNRIRLIRIEKNLGIAAALNKGLEVASGKYIARMDADDISLPNRLSMQLDYMEKNSSCSVVATRIALIDNKGNIIGYWREDIKTTQYYEIRNFLPRKNCIAHPTVMIKTAIAKKYTYNENQPYAQDYDLWLRLCSNGERIEKINEVLLYHRIHPISVTYLTISSGAERKNIKTKAIFLRDKIKTRKLTFFDLRVFIFLLQDLSIFIAGKIKYYIYSGFKKLFIFLGYFIGLILRRIFPFKSYSPIFFFFPFCHIGGAEKIHADIVNCIADKKPLVFFTKKSKNTKFKYLFQRGNVKIFDISLFVNIRFLHHICMGIIIIFINKHSKAVVFGANNEFFYKLLSYLKSNIRRIDLLHAFGGGLEEISLPFVSQIDIRIVTNTKTLTDLKEQYQAYGINPKFADRIVLIENKVKVPNNYPVKKKKEKEELKVLYVGRGSKEKRVHLIGEIATQCNKARIPARFILVGDVYEAVKDKDRKFCIFEGEITEHEKLNKIYEEADIFILTSEREGLPLALMEAMAHGVVPVVVKVGDIPTHIKNRFNGFLVENGSEKEIINSMEKILQELSMNRSLLRTLSFNAYQYALNHFRKPNFCSAYRKIILEGIC